MRVGRRREPRRWDYLSRESIGSIPSPITVNAVAVVTVVLGGPRGFVLKSRLKIGVHEVRRERGAGLALALVGCEYRKITCYGVRKYTYLLYPTILKNGDWTCAHGRSLVRHGAVLAAHVFTTHGNRPLGPTVSSDLGARTGRLQTV